jgi:hypothetical protein
MLAEEEVFFRMLRKLSSWERECGRGWSREKCQDDPGCGWEICKWEVSDHVWSGGTPFRNQKVNRQIFSSVKWKTNFTDEKIWGRNILGNLNLTGSEHMICEFQKQTLLGNLNLTGSEHMICEFQKQNELDYTDRRKVMDEKNASTALDNTSDDIQEVRDNNGGDDERVL